VSAASNGALKIDMYPGGTLGRDPSAQIKYLQDGVLDLSFVIPSYTPGRFEALGIFELPGIFGSATEATTVLWSMFEDGLLTGFDDLKVFQLATTNPSLIHADVPLDGLDKIDGLKLRVAGPTAGEAVRVLGASPVGLPVTQAAELISRGVVDGTTQDWNTYGAFRLDEAARHHLPVRLGQSPMMVAMTQKRFDSLPTEAQEAFSDHSFAKLSLDVAKIHDRITEEWKQKVAADPEHKLYSLTQEEEAQFEEAMKPIVQNWVDTHPEGPALMDELKARLDEYRKSAS